MFKTKTFTLNDMQSNLIGNGDTNKDLHLKPEESAPIVRDYYKTQKVKMSLQKEFWLLMESFF
jgi:hypothetical protein